MKIEVKNENYNKFLKRKEVEVAIEHPEEATPSTVAVQQLFAKQANADIECTEIKEIITGLGTPSSKCLVFVWDEKKAVKKEKSRETTASTGTLAAEPEKKEEDAQSASSTKE